jgi:EAL and modified HD-GYP domain-containing signal transduction protein
MFLMGIFSLMDVMLDKKMCDIIEELPLKDDVKTCLLKNPDQLKSAGLSDMLDLVKNYEKGCWDELKSQQSRLEVSGEIVTDCYIEAIKWAHEVVNIY